jgi:hypothetical protein
MIERIAVTKASYASEDSIFSISSEERKIQEISFPVCSSEEERENGCFLCDFDYSTKDWVIPVNIGFAFAKKVSGREPLYSTSPEANRPLPWLGIVRAVACPCPAPTTARPGPPSPTPS